MLPVFKILNGTLVNITGFQMIHTEKIPAQIETVSTKFTRGILVEHDMVKLYE